MKSKQEKAAYRKGRTAILIDDQLNTQYVYLGLGVKNVKLGIRLMWLLVTRHYLNKESVRQNPRCFIIASRRLLASLWYSMQASSANLLRNILPKGKRASFTRSMLIDTR